MTWTPAQRFDAVMAGEPADRPVVSAWRHHRDSEHPGGGLARWTVEFARRWDFDWLKINPRATYYGEIWGNRYRTGDYEVRDIPRQVSVAIASIADLAGIGAASDSPVLAEQVELSAEVHEAMPDVPAVQTLFSPLSTLIQLAGLSYYPGKPVFGRPGELGLAELFTTDPGLTHAALRAITDTYVDYLGRLRAAGMAGVFYAVTGTAHPRIASPETFAEFSTPYDREILEAAGIHVIVHTCGEHADPQRFAGWPGALSWDQFAPGNPSLDAVDGTVVVGGVDHREFLRPRLIAEQASAAAHVARRRPVLVTPTCSILSAHAGDAGLEAFVQWGRGT